MQNDEYLLSVMHILHSSFLIHHLFSSAISIAFNIAEALLTVS
jgi:hypothetical protein